MGQPEREADPLRWPDSGFPPLNGTEQELESLEGAWADFAYGIRADTPARMVRSASRPSVLAASLLKVHEVLSLYRSKVEGGERAALFDALVFCARENVPLPYWLGDAILNIERLVYREPQRGAKPQNLHHLFGLEGRLPASGSRGIKARRDTRLRVELWVAVHRRMRDEVAAGKRRSIEAALKHVREARRLPYSQRTARALFDEQERIQSEFLDVWLDRQHHRIR